MHAELPRVPPSGAGGGLGGAVYAGGMVAQPPGNAPPGSVFVLTVRVIRPLDMQGAYHGATGMRKGALDAEPPRGRGCAMRNAASPASRRRPCTLLQGAVASWDRRPD